MTNNSEKCLDRRQDVFYDEYKIGTRRVDFFVENKEMIELKASTKLEEVHWHKR